MSDNLPLMGGVGDGDPGVFLKGLVQQQIIPHFTPVLDPSLHFQHMDYPIEAPHHNRRPSVVLPPLQSAKPEILDSCSPREGFHTPLQIHEAMVSRSASPLALGDALSHGQDNYQELMARMLQCQQQNVQNFPAPVGIVTSSDQGWRLPQYRPMQRRDELPSSWGVTRPDPVFPPSILHQAPGSWGGWQDRERHSGQSLSLQHHQDFLRLQERFAGGRGDECGGSGLSRESSRDDINSECEQQFEYEQRFRVDRRKLELMMLNSPEFGEVAAEFFARIGAETDTCVIWPSRLKIGAKSKKDPHIRVGGSEEGVKRAKIMITEVLDTTTNSRVTMKMDVSYTDHSHIIGKGGNTIRRVMAETNCHIHFPDSNRSNPNEKSNQVSIAGEMVGVERARARVRELTPLLFNFDLPIVPSFQAAPDTNSPFLRAIQDQYNIQIMFRQKQKNFHTTTVVVKGCEWECSRVKEATLLLMDNLCTGLAASVPVVMMMEISPQHHSTVLGKANINLKIIMQRTNTVIIFPDAGDPNIPPIKKGSVTISGAIHNVYLARQLLLGSLPIVMMFDLPESLNIDENAVARLQEEQDVTISIKPKARQTNKSCIIKSVERNSAGLYLSRHALLQLDKAGEPLVRAEIPETYKVPLVGSSSNYHMANIAPTRGPYLNINTQLANTFGASPHSPSYLPCTPLYTPSLARPPSPWQLPAFQTSVPPPPPPSTPVGGLSGLPPNHPYLQDYAMLVLGNMTRLQQQKMQQDQQQQQNNIQQHNIQQHHQHMQQVQPQQNDGEQPATSPTQHTGGTSGHSSSGLGSSMQSSPLRSSPRPVPRNSSPVDAAGNLTNNLHKMDLTTASSGIGEGKNSPITDLSAILSEFSAGDRRAPGCEKKVVQIATAADYEQKRLMATKARHHKPMGEARTPNSAWSGLGFSSSMSEAYIRELDHNSVRQKEVASNSDWYRHSANTFESMLAGKDLSDTGMVDGLPVLLATQGLSKYSDIFVRHEIDLPTFVTLTDEDLKEIGIQTFGARKKLLLLAKEARKRKTSQ